jgi:division protein CdvB (Snf7/Vps24/ESCRT-III family)
MENEEMDRSIGAILQGIVDVNKLSKEQLALRIGEIEAELQVMSAYAAENDLTALEEELLDDYKLELNILKETIKKFE